jgi:hypothetical protein
LVGIQDGIHVSDYDPSSDNVRSQHARSNLLEYVVARTEPGEWLDYTRPFAPGLYAAYLRYSSLGATSNDLDLVTSDATQADQTVSPLGTFRMANNIRWPNYLYTPLVDGSGAPVLLNLSGSNTLRLQISGTPGEDNRKAMLNYILLVQSSVEVWSSSSATGSFVLESSAIVDAAKRTITLSAGSSSRFYRLRSGVALSARLISYSGGIVTLGY